MNKVGKVGKYVVAQTPHPDGGGRMSGKTALRPQAGDFTGPDGQTRTGVALTRGGRWLGGRLGQVGGDQVALVTWRGGSHVRQPELYRRVLRACRRPRCLTSLRGDPELEVHEPGARGTGR